MVHGFENSSKKNEDRKLLADAVRRLANEKDPNPEFLKEWLHELANIIEGPT